MSHLHFHSQSQRGFGYVDTIVGIGILTLVFVGIFGAFRFGVELIANSKMKTGATALVNEQMEYVRSLDYDEVGTVGGVPSGDIPQEEEITLNNIEYTRRVFIQYYDAPQDGSGDDDENSITTDYKRVKVEVQWTKGETTHEVIVASNITPDGIESTGSGGTLRVDVFDANTLSVADAEVTIFNDTTTSTVDITTYTNSEGRVSFPGTPEAAGYEVTVSKSGYSTAQTYDTTSENVSPNPGHLSVVEGTITSSSFQIDEVSSITLHSQEPPEEQTHNDTFADTSGISSSTNVTISGGAVTLSGSATSGSVYSTDIADSYLGEWKEASWTDTVPADTSITYRLYYLNNGNRVPIPNTELSGNNPGFDTSPVDISSISTSTYPTLQIGAKLSRDSGALSPEIADWTVNWQQRREPVPNFPFTLRGEKTIGTDSSGSSIYKYEQSHQTDSNGDLTITGLEWDTYHVEINHGAVGKQISEACDPFPIGLAPASTTDRYMLLVPYDPHALRVTVVDAADNPLDNAEVRLYRSDTDVTQTTENCGQTLFIGHSPGTVDTGNEYTLDISRPGYQSKTVSDVEVDGASTIEVILNSSS